MRPFNYETISKAKVKSKSLLVLPIDTLTSISFPEEAILQESNLGHLKKSKNVIVSLFREKPSAPSLVSALALKTADSIEDVQQYCPP